MQSIAIPQFRRWVSTAVLLSCAVALPPDRVRAQTAPAKPTGFATEDGNTQVRLRWAGPNDPTIILWQFTHKLEPLSSGQTSSFGAWTDMPDSGPATRRHTVTGLTNNRTYKFKIRAVNSEGPGSESDEKTGGPYPAAPAKPTGFQAISGDKKAALLWNDADDASIQGWEYRQKASGGAYGSWLAMPGSGANTTTHTVASLENGTEYVFQIQAYNSAGTGYSSAEQSVTPMPTVPGRPTGFSVEAGNRKAVLTWDDPGNDTIAKWQYAYKTTGEYGAWTDMPGSGAATVRHVVSMLENDATHTFKIRAVNDVGDGAESDEISATPIAAAPEKPTGFTALAGNAQVSLSWTDPSDASIMKWQYTFRTSGDYGDWMDIPGGGPTTTGYTVVELVNGTTYVFTIRAVNDVDDGPESDEASATPLSAPAEPSGFSVRAGDARVVLGWNNPLNFTITGWQYSFRTSDDYGAWVDIAGSDANTTGHTVGGLTNGVEHTFRVRAANGSGYGAESDGMAATPRPVPAKPSGLRTEAGNTQIRLVWTDPGDSSISGWQYSFKTMGGYGAWLDIPGSSTATVRHTVTTLANDTIYTFRIRALNGSGAGPESDEASATPRSAAPDKPTGFQVEAGDGEVVLKWDDPDDSSIEGWQYKVRETGGEYSAQWENIPGSGATTVRHTVIGLENGKTYIFKIRAVNSVNGYESDERSATPQSLRPAAPTGLSAEVSDGRVALLWDDPGDATITGWQYAVRTTGGFGEWMDVPGSDATTTGYTVAGLENGTKHAFKLRAMNGHGDGAESGEVFATPVAVPAKPAGFEATPGDGHVVLAWDDPVNAMIAGWQYSVKTTGIFGEWMNIPGSTATTTGYTVTGLANGTSHVFKLRAVNGSGNGMESDEVAATPVPVPAKPTGLVAMPGDRRVTLTWDDPGNATVSKWQFSAGSGGSYGEWMDIPGSDATTTGHTVTGLENGTAYGFKLRAVNASGNGAETDETTATPVPVPAKPAGLTAMPGDRRVVLEWDNPGDATIARWQYSIAATAAYSGWADIPGSDAGTTGHTVTGLDNGTAYRFRVRAVNASGYGAESNEATATPLPVPAKPTGFTATPGSGQVLLEWDDPNDPAITGWAYNQRRAGGEFEEDWTQILNGGNATTGYTVIGLEIGASYGFKVRAEAGDRVGAESDEATVTLPPVPAKPAGFAATPGDGRILLEWAALDDPTVILWQYSYRTTGSYGPWTDIAGSDAATTGYWAGGLDNGTSYDFRIRASNSSGHGLESDEISAVPFAVPAKPAGFTATPGSGQVLLEWDDPNDPAITGWEYNQRHADRAFEEDWTFILQSGAATTSYIVIGLENGVSYTFKLRAVAGDRIGRESEEATARPVAGLPAAPQSLRATAGDGHAALLWDDPANPAITGWQYRYRTTGDYTGWIDIPGSSPSLTGYTATGLANGVVHYFQVRAGTASGFGPPSETAKISPEPSKPRKPTGLQAQPGDGQVVLAWDAAPDPTLHWEYVGWIDDAGTCADGTHDWVDVGRADATGYTVTGLENDVAYCFQVRTARADASGKTLAASEASNPVSATPRAVAKPVERKTVKAVLAGLAGRVAAGAEAMIGTRFSADPATSRVMLAGREVPLFAPVREQEEQYPRRSEGQGTVRSMEGRDMLRGSAFQFPLGPPGGEGLLQWSLWHRGDLRAFQGSAGPQSRYGGRLLSAWFGVDMRWDRRWLAGTALARSKGEIEYAAGSEAGLLKTVLDSVHPYLQRRFEDGGVVWMTLGGGRGAVENTTANRDKETADTELTTASIGFRSPLPGLGGLNFSASGAAGFARLEADGSERMAVGSVSASTDRQSLGLEAALEEGEASRYLSVSLRRDGGDGVTGRGLELASGFRSPLPAIAGHVDIRARWLARHSDRSYREFGLTATVRRPAGANRRGPSWSLVAGHGTQEDGSSKPELLWSDGMEKRGSANTAPALDLRAGWGFVGRGAVFTPHAALGLTGADTQRLSLGIDLGPLSGPTLKLAAERRIPAAGAPESRIAATLRFSF